MEPLKAALHPLSEHGLPQEAKLCAAGQSIVGMSPSTSLKRDRLMHRNAILRRTGFLEGTSIKGSIAGAPVCPTAFSISSFLPYSGHTFQNSEYLQSHKCHALAPCAIYTRGLGSAHPAAGTKCRLCCHAEVLDPIKESKESVAIDVRSGGTTGQGMGSPSQSASTSLPREKHSMLSQALGTSISPG